MDEFPRLTPRPINLLREQGLLDAEEHEGGSGKAFHPRVFWGAGEVAVWLPEFELYGQGATYEEARKDLLEEVRVYVDEYQENQSYQQAPNRRAHGPRVLKASLAEQAGKLEDLIFPGPSCTSAG